MEQQTVKPAEGLTFEKVWAMFQETDRKFQETDRMYKETAQIIKENARKIAIDFEEFKQVRMENERQMKERADRLDKQLGKYGNRLGEIIEYMIMPNLISKFEELGLVFDKICHSSVIADKVNNIFTEIDILLENSDKVMIVEVKTKPTTENITEHIDRMKKLRFRADLHMDKRIMYGAVGGMVFNAGEKHFALRNGFYVIEPSGETFTITKPDNGYSPREW